MGFDKFSKGSQGAMGERKKVENCRSLVLNKRETYKTDECHEHAHRRKRVISMYDRNTRIKKF